MDLWKQIDNKGEEKYWIKKVDDAEPPCIFCCRTKECEEYIRRGLDIAWYPDKNVCVIDDTKNEEE